MRKIDLTKRVKKIDETKLKPSERLSMLADAVELAGKRKRINMDHYASRVDLKFQDLFAPREGFCQTSACALGTAALLFKGLKLTGDMMEYPQVVPVDNDELWLKHQKIADVFGVTAAELDPIFYPRDKFSGRSAKAYKKAVKQLRDLSAHYAEQGR